MTEPPLVHPLLRCDRDGCKRPARHSLTILCECKYSEIKECENHCEETKLKVDRRAWICTECWTFLDIEQVTDYA